MAFGDYQNEIYLQGLAGVVPSLPMVFAELEAKAEKAMPPSVWSYVAGGAGDERTQRANREAFERWGLMPRMFVGAARARPVGRAVRADPAVAAVHGADRRHRAVRPGRPRRPGHRTRRRPHRRADGRLDADRRPDGGRRRRIRRYPGLFQLYTPTDRELAASLVQRAEAAGFKGIVVTLDTWVTGWRPRDLTTSNFPQLRGHCLANYTSDPVFRASLQQPPEENPQGAVLRWVQVFGNPLDLGRPAAGCAR